MTSQNAQNTMLIQNTMLAQITMLEQNTTLPAIAKRTKYHVGKNIMLHAIPYAHRDSLELKTETHWHWRTETH